MPAIVAASGKSSMSASFRLSSPRQRQIAEMELRDCSQRLPGVGLGYNQAMRWGTAGAFSELFSHIEEDMEDVDFPFLVIHDPEDSTCLFSGSERLIQLAPSEDKLLYEMHTGGLHCLPMAELEDYVRVMTSWMKKRC
eukprot:TRINITY_DN7087_c0_g1_i2.p1 TRINITY_DN7087_c0_g1~~TRINITY_DN7087_c0_g1_i2.p1  ORF type:complete len:138 (+),score=32.86 TRINITY_DN7087_c0_g1_i2:264-677(+)